MRATTLLNRLLDLPGIIVRGVALTDGRVIVEVALRRRRLSCPHCDYHTRWRYDTRPVASVWRGLAFGVWLVYLRAGLLRLDCPTHGLVTEAVPFARHRSGFTRDLEDVTAFLATRTDKTTIARFLLLDSDTIGRICDRVALDELDPDRLDALVTVGVDEVSWKNLDITPPLRTVARYLAPDGPRNGGGDPRPLDRGHNHQADPMSQVRFTAYLRVKVL